MLTLYRSTATTSPGTMLALGIAALRQDVFLAVPRSSTCLHFGRVGQHAVTEGLQAFGRQLNGQAVGRAAIFTTTVCASYRSQLSTQRSAACDRQSTRACLQRPDPSFYVTPPARMPAA